MKEPKYWLIDILKKVKHKKCFAFTYIVICLIIIFLRNFLVKSEFDIVRVIELTFAASWLLIGPMAILTYYKNFAKLSENVPDTYSEKYIRIIESNYLLNYKIGKIIALIWELLLGGIILIYPNVLITFSIYGYSDIWYWVFFAIAIYLLDLTACGLGGVISSLLLLVKLKHENVIQSIATNKNVLNRIITYYTTTTLCFSSGVVFMPILLDFYNANKSKYGIMIFIAMTLYSVFMLAIFIFPVKSILNVINEVKEEKIDAINNKYLEAVANNEHMAAVDYYFQIKYWKENDMKPVEYKKIIQVITVAIIPILSYILNNISLIQNLIDFLNI